MDIEAIKNAEAKLKAGTDSLSWDAETARFLLENGSRFTQAAVRIGVFKNNQTIFSAWKYQAPSGKQVPLGDRNQLLDSTKVYREQFRVDDVPECGEPLHTACFNEDCLVVAKNLMDRGYNPAVLNLADAYAACGMYNKGSNAQEESLCRASTLSQTLNQYYNKLWAKKAGVSLRKQPAYPMDMRYGCIYSPGVAVFRDGQNSGYALREEPFKTAIISLAALNFREEDHPNNCEFMNPDGGFTPEGIEVMKDKIRTIYRVALSNGHDSLVLGAFGCGVFRLPSDVVAGLFRDILDEEEFKGKFRYVCFAILERRKRDGSGLDGKFRAFYQLFNQ